MTAIAFFIVPVIFFVMLKLASLLYSLKRRYAYRRRPACGTSFDHVPMAVFSDVEHPWLRVQHDEPNSLTEADAA